MSMLSTRGVSVCDITGTLLVDGSGMASGLSWIVRVDKQGKSGRIEWLV